MMAMTTIKFDQSEGFANVKSLKRRSVLHHTDLFRHSSFGFRHFRCGGLRLLLQATDDADERREEGKHNRANNHRQKHDHDWLQH